MKAIRAWFFNAVFLILSGRLKTPFLFSEHFILQTGFSLHSNNGSPSKHTSTVLLAVFPAANNFQVCQIQMSKGILCSRKLNLPRTIPIFPVYSIYFIVSFSGLM